MNKYGEQLEEAWSELWSIVDSLNLIWMPIGSTTYSAEAAVQSVAYSAHSIEFAADSAFSALEATRVSDEEDMLQWQINKVLEEL